MRLTVTVAWFAVSLGIVGCGSSSTKKIPADGETDMNGPSGDMSVGSGDMNVGSGDLSTISPSDACTAYATTYCNVQSTCNPNAGATKYNGDCVTRRATACINGLNAPGTGATAGNTATCAAALSTISCDDFGNNIFPLPCRTATGTVTNGNACNFSPQCQSGFCAVGPGSNCGVCAAASTNGSDCTQTNNACAPGTLGLYCSKLDGTCKPHSGIGQPCDEDASCGYRLGCVGNMTAKGVQGSAWPR